MATHTAPGKTADTRRVLLLVALLLALGFLLGSALSQTLEAPRAEPVPVERSRPAAGARVEPPFAAPDFTLTSQTGQPISLSDLRGRPVLMFFGYTHCPDVCPTTLADYRRVKQLLGAQAANAEFVFISVDGARDTPDVVAQYLDQFDAGFIGMTGSEAELAAVGAVYGLTYERVTSSGEPVGEAGHGHSEQSNSENYFVEHTSPSFLIDPNGRLRMVYFYNTQPEAIASDIRQLLAQGQS